VATKIFSLNMNDKYDDAKVQKINDDNYTNSSEDVA